MNDDYFARLDAELSACTRTGAHLDARRRHLRRVVRHAAAAAALTVALAATLVGEFPASARGQAVLPPSPVAVQAD